MHHAENAHNHGDTHEKRHLRLGIGIAIGVHRQRPCRKCGGDDTHQPIGAAQRRQNLT
ncbi:hypothetical protein ALP15_200008 [Pseudomonas savastanoi]|uniref:Uncharacterized protein n=1 Tax=Pseudomonas savastanoi TaxID=29438 RepID=A0A3M6AAI2_PSESS|nr:hypothetical protein ALP15_200008 [Pseudomonas savastanoi]